MNEIPEDILTGYEDILKKTDLALLFKERQKKIFSLMEENKIDVALFSDFEESRDVTVRYLTGHPSDALLLLYNNKSTLIPWDENLAEKKAHTDKMLPYTNFNRVKTEAVKECLKEVRPKFTNKIRLALPSSISHLEFIKFQAELENVELLCSEEEDSLAKKIESMRAQKDAYEVACTVKACTITSAMTDIIVSNVLDGRIKTESDVALFIEKELREKGCERTSFDTLAAGPSRSFAIHAFPGYTSSSWSSRGLSILDYGVCYEGYASDCTITIARGPLSTEQVELLDLVQKAADECLKLYKNGKAILDAAKKAEEIFAQAGKAMPHSLGHGTGLEIHEAPFISLRAKEDSVFKEGNIVTLEPGLYYPELGGCRLENDILITKDGNKLLTNSKIFRI